MEVLWNKQEVVDMIDMHGYKTYGYDRKARLIKCTLPQFKCVSVIDKAKKIIFEFDKQWKHSKKVLVIKKTLGAKHHCVEYMSIWRMPIGYISEQSVESFQKLCQSVFHRYQGQRG